VRREEGEADSACHLHRPGVLPGRKEENRGGVAERRILGFVLSDQATSLLNVNRGLGKKFVLCFLFLLDLFIP